MLLDQDYSLKFDDNGITMKSYINKRTWLGKKGVATAFHFFIITILFIMLCITIMFFFWAVKFYNGVIDSYQQDLGWIDSIPIVGQKADITKKLNGIRIGGGDKHSVVNAPINIYDFMLFNILYTNYDNYVNMENGDIKHIFKYRYTLAAAMQSKHDKSSLFKDNFDRFKRINPYLDFYLKQGAIIESFSLNYNPYKPRYTQPILVLINRVDSECSKKCVTNEGGILDYYAEMELNDGCYATLDLNGIYHNLLVPLSSSISFNCVTFAAIFEGDPKDPHYNRMG